MPDTRVTDSRLATSGSEQSGEFVPATRVLVLRHGQSEWNALGRWQGQADPPLTALGEQQARVAGRLLASECPPFEAVVTSDLDRARLTGETIAGIIGCPVHTLDPRWRENHAGEWQGLTPDEIRQQWPGYLDSNRRPPGFETAESTISRSLAALESIAADHPGACVLVISHGGVLRLLHDLLGGPDQRFPNLSGVWFERDGADDITARTASSVTTESRVPWRLGSLLFPLQVVADELRVAGSVE
jgi:probable phosphoglycerate mutase